MYSAVQVCRTCYQYSCTVYRTGYLSPLQVDQVGLLVAQEVDEHATLHLREGDLDRGPGQVAEVGRLGRLLDLLLD